MQEQELAITVDAHIDVQLEVEHLIRAHAASRSSPRLTADGFEVT